MTDTPSSPTVTGIVEAALHVGDVVRSMDFYQGLFGFEAELRNEAIGVLRIPGGQGLILFPRTNSPQPVVAPALAVEGTIPAHGASGPEHGPA